MHFIVLTILLGLCAVFLPKTWVVIKFLFIGPLLGLVSGGFIWAIVAMFCNALITWAAFGTFVLGGTVLAEILLARAD